MFLRLVVFDDYVHQSTLCRLGLRAFFLVAFADDEKNILQPMAQALCRIAHDAELMRKQLTWRGPLAGWVNVPVGIGRKVFQGLYQVHPANIPYPAQRRLA